MASEDALITKANFDTTAYTYQTTSLSYATRYYFYKHNVSFDLYINGPIDISLEFYDYEGTWIPYTSSAGTSGDGISYQYRNVNTFRFFHNCLANYNNGAYTADTKIKDKSVTYGGHTYDTRGYHLWRISVYVTINPSFVSHDFHINSFGAGKLTDQEYEDVCKGKLIYCGGKGSINSDDQHITTSSADSEWNTKFIPSARRGDSIDHRLDRQCIPDWRWAKT